MVFLKGETIYHDWVTLAYGRSVKEVLYREDPIIHRWFGDLCVFSDDGEEMCGHWREINVNESYVVGKRVCYRWGIPDSAVTGRVVDVNPSSVGRELLVRFDGRPETWYSEHKLVRII